jgi:tetratricopeptide (TPR) repeat protein
MVASTTTCKIALQQPAIPKTDPASDARSSKHIVAHKNRRVSVPFNTIPTFANRPHLSTELNEKLGKAHESALAHAVAVIGLGGIGKTQLVLRYIEQYGEEYDVVLWIDVRSKETVRSSYERCCRILGLPIEASTGDVSLKDMPAVQAVQSWLLGCGEDKRWLAVLDNADDLSWDVSSIVPKGKAGSVIVTSQDAQASRLLGGRTPTVRVDAMEPEEAVCLVSNYFDEPLWREDGCLALVEEITECLDRLAVALDLAGARIRADVENGADAATALRDYLTDHRRNQNKLLRDEEFACVSAYKKTVWTAWDTSLASLRKVEDSQPDIYPVQLLSFVTLLDRTHVQDELFRLASLGLEETCERLNIEAPAWMQGLLRKRQDERWDDFSYRASVKLLLRYGLVRPVGETWKGITMHSLVQWRADAGMDREQYWRLYLAFMAAVCVKIGKEADHVRFRRHVMVHLPPMDSLLAKTDGVDEEGLCWMWSWVGQVLWQEGRWKEAEKLDIQVMEARQRVLGEEHPDTIRAMGNLAATYWKQGRWKEAEEAEIKVLEARRRVLGEEHLDTIRATANLAATYRSQGLLKKAEELFVKVLETSRRVLGEEHPDTIDAMANLASTYRNQGRLKEADEAEVKVMEARRRVLGEEHLDTIRSMGNLAATYWEQGRLKEAEELEVKVMEGRRVVLGEEHPDTLTAMGNLAATYRKQGRLKEAEELLLKVLEARRRVLGEEHPDTIDAMANLASTYWKQGRLKEAEELFVKVMEARRRVLGEDHPSTLGSMAALATVLKTLRAHQSALELIDSCIRKSEHVLGINHPYTITHGNLKKQWIRDLYDTDETKGNTKLGESQSSSSDRNISPTTDSHVDYCEVISQLVRECLQGAGNIHFQAQWELEQFTSQHLGEDESFEDCLTVTGNGDTAYATSCQQYVRWKWGSIGLHVLDSVPRLLSGGMVCAEHFQLTSSTAGYHAKLLTRESSIAIPIVQTLAWLASVFRLPQYGPPHWSALQFIQGDGTFSITLGKLSLARDSPSACWHNLLPNTVVATGFPVRMPDETGLDVEFEVMLDLADILFQSDLANISSDTDSSSSRGIFYTGVGTLLYPVSRSSNDQKIIMWHFGSSAERSVPRASHFLPLQEHEISRMRHVVGFAPYSKVQLGTHERTRSLAGISRVAGCIERERPEVTVETVTAQFGKAPVTASIGGKVKFSRALRATVDPEKRRYDQILTLTEKQAVILFDCGTTKAAWLVSQLSIILDLVCYRIRANGWRDLPMHATPQADGGAAAAAVLKDPSVYKLEFSHIYEDNTKLSVMHVVREIYCAMSQRQILQELRDSAALRLYRERLYGWDLLELAEPSDNSYRREIVVHKTTSRAVAQYPSWLPLARHIPVYIGQDLGEIITVDQHAPLQNIQNKEKYLLASVCAMRQLLRRRPGCIHFHFDCELVWECPPRGYPFVISQDECDEDRVKRCVQRLTGSGRHRCTTGPMRAPLCEEGLVIFGPETHLLSRMNEAIDRIMPDNL